MAKLLNHYELWMEIEREAKMPQIQTENWEDSTQRRKEKMAIKKKFHRLTPTGTSALQEGSDVNIDNRSITKISDETLRSLRTLVENEVSRRQKNMVQSIIVARALSNIEQLALYKMICSQKVNDSKKEHTQISHQLGAELEMVEDAGISSDDVIRYDVIDTARKDIINAHKHVFDVIAVK